MAKNKSSPKKDKVNQAAIELFARHGFNGATIKDITSKAGITEGALYRHYKSKEEMMAILYAKEMELLVTALIELPSNAQLYPRIHQVIETVYRYYDAKPYSLIFLIRNFHIIPQAGGHDLRSGLYDFIAQYASCLCDRPEPDIEAALLPSLLSGIILQPIIFHHYQKLPLSPLNYVNAVTASCCRMLGFDHGAQA
jgi:AcrR family transcriptional regulator